MASSGSATSAAAGAAKPQFGMLVRNYRSHPRLLELPSRLFYQDRLLVSWTVLLLLLLLLLPLLLQRLQLAGALRFLQLSTGGALGSSCLNAGCPGRNSLGDISASSYACHSS